MIILKWIVVIGLAILVFKLIKGLAKAVFILICLVVLIKFIAPYFGLSFNIFG